MEVAGLQEGVGRDITPASMPTFPTASERLAPDQRESCVDFQPATPFAMESSECVGNVELGVDDILVNFSGAEMSSHFDPSCGEPAPDWVPNPQAMDVVADDVDNFLDEFLCFAVASESENGGHVGDKLLTTDAELAWLQDPDAFMPTPSPAHSCKAGVSSESAVAERVLEGGKDELSKDEVMKVEGATILSSVGGAVEAQAAVDRSVSTTSTLPAKCPLEQEDESRARKDKARREKVARYLEKKKRRKWSREAPYKSRQRVANARPRYKGRFLPLESEFVPIAELQRRQRVLFRQQQEQQQQQHPALVMAPLSTVRMATVVDARESGSTPVVGPGANLQERFGHSTPVFLLGAGVAI